MSDIMVSIICTCYNHGDYIRQTLDSFVNQITDFEYEVIVHDDASTDNSAQIIAEFEKSYSDIVKPIYQKENQYSKKISVDQTFMWPKCKGKYIALCEGDDYWTVTDKLQKQVDFLEAHDDYVACVHNSICHHMDTGKENIMYSQNDNDISVEDVLFAGGTHFHTSSILCRKDVFINRPEWTTKVYTFGVADYQNGIHMALSGKVKYFGDVMSCYRLGVPGSWTKRMNINAGVVVSLKENLIKMLLEVDKYSEHKYLDTINKAITNYEYEILELKDEYSTMKSGKYRDLYNAESAKRKAIIFVKQYFRNIYRPLILKIKR